MFRMHFSRYPVRMKSSDKAAPTAEAVVRRRNQITLPRQIADALGVGEGGVVVIEAKSGSAIIRPVRRSYAGIARGVYGDADHYVSRERAGWGS